jgi:hypothetical protein
MKQSAFGFLSLGAVVALLLVVGQSPFAAASFDFGHYTSYEGVLEDWPYPMLVTSSGRFLLVGEGKHGFEPGDLSGQQVRLRGALIRRDDNQMLEVESGSAESIAIGHSHEEPIDLGPIQLTGEIVDSKCYLGVMNPGSGKVHRDCAARCISGGAPPAFLARDSSGEVRLLLLTGGDGRALNREVLDYVSEPITVSGRIFRKGTTFILKAEPKDFRRE